MEEFFGISMTWIMLALLVLLGITFAVVAYVIVRTRIMFLMGLRNMPRRMAQTALIIIGLMLSTLIISAAFATGDTVDHSLSAQAYGLLGHSDVWVNRLGEGDEPPEEIDSTIPAGTLAALRAAVEERNDPNIDGFLPMFFRDAPMTNERSGQSEPSINIAGVDETALEGFPDIVSSTTGAELDIATLSSDEAFMNESAADALASEPGDVVQVFVNNQVREFTIVDIVEDTLATGVGGFENREGVVTRLETVQELFGQPGEVSLISVSNRGGIRDGLDLTDEVVDSLSAAFFTEGIPRGTLDTYDVKRDLVEGSEEAANFMTTFFFIFGLFSIASGMLLIVMIFVMLAAERKPELGMARAVGTKRGHLVQMFLSEGMAYNVLAAAVGAALGIAVAFGIAAVMGRIFGDFFDIEGHVTPRSVIISYSLGVVLTFITVTFASWRVSNLNIVAAIRDLPDNAAGDTDGGTLTGYLRGVMNAVVFSLTIVGPFVYLLRGHPFSFPAHQRIHGERVPVWPFLIVPLAPFYLLALGIVMLTRDRRPAEVPAWLLVTGIALPPLGLVAAGLQQRDRSISWRAGFATIGIGLGALFVLLGLSSDTAFPFALGFSLVTFGVAVLLNYFGAGDRPVYTAAGIFLLVFWGLVAGNRLHFLFGTLDGDVEMFFLSGIVMVAASTFVLVYNGDLMLAVVSRLSSSLTSLLPAIKTAVAYPLASRFRTGMTLAMISLVIFALTMMSTMNLNFVRLFLADEARGGWDVTVDENPSNPIADLPAALAAGGSDVASKFRTTGRIGLAAESRVSEVGVGDYEDYPVLGVDAGFAQGGSIPLSGRARGYESDEQVWAALAEGRDVAIVDRFTVEGGGFNFGGEIFSISGIDPNDDLFDPITIGVLDPIAGAASGVEVIGVIDFGASANFFGIYVSDATFREVFGEPLLSRHVIGLNDPDESKDVAREIEATLLRTGVQAESLKERVEDDQALTRNFFLLMQGFVGLGLFVGIAAVGVIAFRTVVERRQQIGMLRAIGYRRSTVALSFMLESAFITLLGIASGVGLAVWLSFFLITSDEFPAADAGYAIPWARIGMISGFAFLASLVMTYIPSRQAASVPIAEALRYE